MDDYVKYENVRGPISDQALTHVAKKRFFRFKWLCHCHQQGHWKNSGCRTLSKVMVIKCQSLMQFAILLDDISSGIIMDRTQ